jgi:hypothetical protein
MCYLCKTSNVHNGEALALLAGEVPARHDVAPFVARNKGGIPVTRLRAIITLKDRRPAFSWQTTLLGQTPHIISGIGGLGGARTPIQFRENRQFVSLPSRGVRGNGGVLFLPQPGNNTVQLYTWNTEPMRLSWITGNSSHAEVQFIRWFSEHVKYDPQFSGRVEHIKLFISRPPCPMCQADLCAFATRFSLKDKLWIEWNTTKGQVSASAEAMRKLKTCDIRLDLKQKELQLEIPPRLGTLKTEKQQAHTYLLDKRVHAAKPTAINRRLERLLKDQDKKQTSILSRVFASPHNRSRIKAIFQRAINQGNYKPKAGGGWESIIRFKQSTGWSHNKPVYRLRAIIDSKGNWHYHPVP